MDYTNIPWRSTRFDEEALTTAVATQRRAENALEQFRKRAARRALGFCVSQRHADFMAGFFARGLRAVAVHSGPPRRRGPHRSSLEAGELDIVFAVDMFNEGVDLPHAGHRDDAPADGVEDPLAAAVRPGLAEGAPGRRLTVIDYIGNHRLFLLKPQTLSGCRRATADLQPAGAAANGTQELPPGCEVTYELEAVEILKSLLLRRPARTRLSAVLRDFKDLHGVRPTAVEVYQDGYNPRAVRERAGSWIRFVGSPGDLDESAATALESHGAFINALDTTEMVKSYKMLVLLAMLNANKFPGSIADR